MSFCLSSPVFPIVTQEEFNLFHNIDRTLFTCLVIYLNYNPADATNIMAILIWVERYGYESNVVAGILNFPIQIIDVVADECSMIWQCLEIEMFPYHLEGDNGDIPMIQNITSWVGIDLHYFHDNRHDILPSVLTIMQDVCVRAFSDIVFPSPNKPVPLDNGKSPIDVFYGGATMNPTRRIVHWGNSSAGLGVMAPQMVGVPQTVIQGDQEAYQNVPFVHPDDRTIFITFSRGYSVSDFELGDYITRRFGNIIEAIHMQDVTGTHLQPLFARVVVHSEKIIPAVLGGLFRVKFTINGKHVWARKYTANASKSTDEASTSKWKAK